MPSSVHLPEFEFPTKTTQ